VNQSAVTDAVFAHVDADDADNTDKRPARPMTSHVPDHAIQDDVRLCRRRHVGLAYILQMT